MINEFCEVVHSSFLLNIEFIEELRDLNTALIKQIKEFCEPLEVLL